MEPYDPLKRPERLQYLNFENLGHTQRIMAGYYHDLIGSYGVDVTYFRKENNFLTPTDNPSIHSNHVYGEDEDAAFYLNAPMTVYMEMQGDSFLLSKFGISTNGDASVYFTIEMFNEQFRDQLGEIITSDMLSTPVVETTDDSFFVMGVVTNADIKGKYKVEYSKSELTRLFTEAGKMPVLLPINASIERDLKVVNPDIILPHYYYAGTDTATDGTLDGIVQYDGTVLTVIGNEISGEISYHTQDPVVNAGEWELAPQVGDFFKLEYGTATKKSEEYEISRIYDRNLQTDGLNPLLGTYIWRCDVIRRTPSFETVDSDLVENPAKSLFAEPVNPILEVINEKNEATSNDIFDYRVDASDNLSLDLEQDDVYGGY